MIMKAKRLHPKAIMPAQGSVHAAGYDLHACIDEDIIVNPGENKLIGTGWAMAVPLGYGAFVYARSGMAVKQGLRPANCVGVIDADYRGEFMVAVYNDSKEPKVIRCGDRIAQMVIAPYLTVQLMETDELDETVRGAGGFGSTGM